MRLCSREEILAPYALLPLAVAMWFVDLKITALVWTFVAGYILARNTEHRGEIRGPN
jgi:hypothetical protein